MTRFVQRPGVKLLHWGTTLISINNPLRVTPACRSQLRQARLKKFGRQAIHLAPSSDSPPPGTIMCTCG
jgi:hypothetical protein